MEKQTQQIVSDVHSFDKEVSIYKILFQDKTTSLLKYVIEKISIDKNDNMITKLPSILISGREGKKLIIRALSNSLCNRFEHIQGNHLVMGGCCGSLYKKVDHQILYFVSSAEELASSSITLLYKFLTQCSVRVRNYMPDEYKTVSAQNKLFVFSVNDPKKLCPDLYKEIDYHCYLQGYSAEQMEIIVEQRLKWCAVDYQKEIPAIIAHNCKTIARCIRLLSVCFLIMRSDGRTNMIMEDVQKGISLNASQVGIQAPPIPEDIPF